MEPNYQCKKQLQASWHYAVILKPLGKGREDSKIKVVSKNNIKQPTQWQKHDLRHKHICPVGYSSIVGWLNEEMENTDVNIRKFFIGQGGFHL